MTPIFLDHAAGTPPDPRVLAAMRPWLEGPANPHAESHAFGRLAAEAVDEACRRIAGAIGAQGAEIVLTSGATESNALAILGVARAAGRGRVVTVATEHASVLAPVAALAREGFEAVMLPVDRDGRVDPGRVAAALDRGGAVLVSVMAANNETGVVQPLAEIGAVCRAHRVPFHCDAAQALATEALDIGALGIDLLSLSAHKAGGPMGIGALYVRRKPPVALAPLFAGGGQQRGRRGGTVPTPLAVGFGEAARIDVAERTGEAARRAALRDRLLAGLETGLGPLRVHGAGAPRLPGHLSLLLPQGSAEEVMAAVPGLALASGAACASAERAPSHVLLAMGATPVEAARTLRLTLGRTTTEAEVDQAVARLVEVVGSTSAIAAAAQ